MTTITNFLESNFVDSAENKDLDVSENPIWILNVPTNVNLNQSALRDYIVNHSVQTLKYFSNIINIDR